MKNSLGNPARGDGFYPRKKEIAKIYKTLRSQVSIYLSAPRRVGKTSILKFLDENPEKGFYFIYIITESVYDENEFYKTVFEELLKTTAIKGLAKLSEKAKDFFGKLLDRVQSIQGIEIRQGETPDYFNLLIELLSHISTDYGKVIIMIDEFPQTIQNILESQGSKEAQHFIQSNRALRHEKNLQGKVSFIYTGSVSLVPMVEKVTSLTGINDLFTILVNPLGKEDATDFLVKLMSAENVKINSETIAYILNRIGWLIPFHIQLIQQEIVDVYEATGGEINKPMVDKAFEQVIHTRNKPQFEPYFSRLSKIFKGNDHAFVMEVLKRIAANDAIGMDIISDMSVKYDIAGNLKFILDTLEGDGYIFKNNGEYRYTSPILQLWCKKHICE